MSNRPRNKIVTNAEIVQALREAHGLVSVAAKRLGIARQTIHVRIKRSADVAQAVRDARAELVDLAESALRTAVEAGEPWAVSLVLRTLGAKRGYATRTEVSGVAGGPIRIVAVDYAAAIADIAPPAPPPGSGGDSALIAQNNSSLCGAQMGKDNDGR